jgi:hypothetical protein
MTWREPLACVLAAALTVTSAIAQDFPPLSDQQILIQIERDWDAAAVVWFSRHLTGPSKGRQLELTYRYVDVFVFRDGRWQCVASQSTKVTKE